MRSINRAWSSESSSPTPCLDAQTQSRHDRNGTCFRSPIRSTAFRRQEDRRTGGQEDRTTINRFVAHWLCAPCCHPVILSSCHPLESPTHFVRYICTMSTH